VLLMLAAYAGCEAAGVPIAATLTGLGLAMSAAIAALMIRSRRAFRSPAPSDAARSH
jgi:MFS transporter, LPLT family, lysophospholipid transporter